MTDADTPSTDAQRFFLKSQPEYDHIVSQLIKHQRKPQQMKPDKDCLFTAVLQQVYHWANYVTPDMLHKQMALYMIKRPHIFYPHISKQLMKDKESYESFVTNIFNGIRWGEWISLVAICHMWNIPIRLVTPYCPSVINMFHTKEECVVIVIANGWPEDGVDITHYAALVRIDEDKKQIPNANQKGEELIPKNYRNLNKARSNALEFSVERNKSLLVCYYNEIESDMDLIRKEVKKLNNMLEHLDGMKQKVKRDLELMGVEVKQHKRKETELQGFQQQQQTMTTIMTEDQHALEGLLDLQTQEVENQQYIQQQTLEYPEMGNVTQPQLQQVVTYPQIPKVNYPCPTSTVISEGGHKIIPIRQQGPTLTVTSAEAPSGNIVISLQDQQCKMSDQDIIRLLSTESGPDTSGRDTIVFMQTGQTVTPVQGQSEIELIDELPIEHKNINPNNHQRHWKIQVNRK